MKDPIVGGALTEAWNRVRRERGTDRFTPYRDDPVGFIENVIGSPLWSAEDSPTGQPGQREIAEAVGKNESVAWGACHGAGKDFLIARLMLWFWTTRPQSVVVSTAPTHQQVENLLWREVREAHRSATVALPGRVLTKRAEMGHPRWYMFGFSTDTPAGRDTAVSAQGIHADGGVFFAADEASGIDQQIFNTADGYLTQGNGKRVYISNQNLRHGAFYDAMNSPSSPFVTFQTSAFDVPEVFNGQTLMSREWIATMQKKCGPDYSGDPLYQVQVLGVPPTSDTHSLISRSILEQNADLNPESMGRTIGVDIARMGDDKCVAYLNDRGRLKARHEWTKARTHESAEIIAQLMAEWKVTDASSVKVDSTGVGGGVVDDLFRRGIYVEAIDFGAGPKGDWQDFLGDTVKFRNRRSELHYIYYRLMGSHLLAVPERYAGAWDDTLAMRQIPDEAGYFKIEPKDMMKKRIGHSPDDTDAILCSLSKGGASKAVEGTGRVFRRRRR